MKQRTKVVARTLVSVSGAATIAILLQGCPDQPEMDCNVTRGPFSARYTVVEKTGTCDDVTEIAGEIIGVEQYFAEKGGRKPDLDKPSVALQALAMGDLATTTEATYGVTDPNPEHRLYALGALNSPDPSSNFCTVGSFSSAQLELPAIPPQPAGDGGAGDGGLEEEGGVGDGGSEGGGDNDAGSDASFEPGDGGGDGAPAVAFQEEEEGLPGQDAVSIRYDWSNVRFIVKPEIPGQAFDGDLAVTQGACTIRYRVNAIAYPMWGRWQFCSAYDDAGNPVGPDDAFCATKANPAAGVPYGSALNPRFKTYCEPSTLLCVLADDVANYR